MAKPKLRLEGVKAALRQWDPIGIRSDSGRAQPDWIGLPNYEHGLTKKLRPSVSIVLMTVAVLFLLPALPVNGSANNGDEFFHVQFGTRKHSSSAGGGDDGRYIVELADGRIVVGGYAEGARHDAGGTPPKPMIAAFSSNGALLSQVILDRVGWNILAMNGSRVLLSRPSPYRHQHTHQQTGEYDPGSGYVELWSFSADFGLDERLLSFAHSNTQVSAKTDADGFTLWLSKHDFRSGAPSIQFMVRAFSWDGRETKPSQDFAVDVNETLFVDDELHIGVRQWGDYYDLHRSFVIANGKGESRESTQIPGCGHCRFLSSLRSENTLEILVQPSWMETDWSGLRLLHLDLESGAIEVAAEFGALYGATATMRKLADGSAVITGWDSLAAVVARLSRDRELLWVRRFQSGRRVASVSSAELLRDGRLALVGITTPHLSMDQEADGDAFLLVGDHNGRYLSQFGNCLVHDGSLAESLYDLETELGLKLPLNRLNYGSFPSISSDSPLPAAVSPRTECGSQLEKRLLEFSSYLSSQVDGPYSEYPSVARLHLELEVDRNSAPGQAFVYRGSSPRSRFLPRLLADANQPKKVAAEIQENVVPFLHKVTMAHRQLEVETGYHFQNGVQPSGWTSIYASDGPEPLTPREAAGVLEVLARSFETLGPQQKQRIKASAGAFTPVVIVEDLGDIRRGEYSGYVLPENKVGGFWIWLLDEVLQKNLGVGGP